MRNVASIFKVSSRITLRIIFVIFTKKFNIKYDKQLLNRWPNITHNNVSRDWPSRRAFEVAKIAVGEDNTQIWHIWIDKPLLIYYQEY